MTEPQLRRIGVSPALSAAYDILDDAGVFTGDDEHDVPLLTLCLAAERKGHCPETFARGLVALRKSL